MMDDPSMVAAERLLPVPPSSPTSECGHGHDSITSDTLQSRKECHEASETEQLEIRHHTLGLWLFLLYALVAILSWSITCVLCHRPLGATTWFDQKGRYTPELYRTSQGFRRAAGVGLSIVFATGIPLTNAIAARAAAVYCQRNSDSNTPRLTLRHMLALADKGWAGVEYIRDVLRPRVGRHVRTPLLVLATALVGLAFSIPILQTIFLRSVHVKVRPRGNFIRSSNVGYWVTPEYIASVENGSVLDNVISETLVTQMYDSQPNVWVVGPNTLNVSSLSSAYPVDRGLKAPDTDVFVSSVPVGTDTGVFRNLATRFNTSIKCELIPSTEYPRTCIGASPFERNFSNIGDADEPAPYRNVTKMRYKGRICATGDTQRSAWDISTGRQDVIEELWLDFQFSNFSWIWFSEMTDTIDKRANFTQHCSVNTTLGYFELPNYFNGHRTGPLLDTIPPQNSNRTYDNYYSVTTKPYGTKKAYGAPAPLLGAALAIFGDNTFFDSVTNVSTYNLTRNSPWSSFICPNLRYPFSSILGGRRSMNKDKPKGFIKMDWDLPDSRVNCKPYSGERLNATDVDNPRSYILQAFLIWFTNFANPVNTAAALALTTLSVEKQIFAQAAVSIPIRGFNGYDIQKPDMPPAAMIIISLLLAIQLSSLAFLAFYACLRPSWTAILDSTAILKIGVIIGAEKAKHKEGELTSADITMETPEEKMKAVLECTDGWVGEEAKQPSWNREGANSGRRLVLGGQEAVRGRRTAATVNRV